jgi:hypothetical protein
MRPRLTLISFFLILTSSCTITEDEALKDLLGSFKASDEYITYLKERPITSQVIVVIKIEETDKEYVFPNPYVAKLFVKFVETKANLNATKKKPNLLN